MIEAVVLGRVGVDLTPPTPRTALAEATSFVRAVGGYGGNVAVGLARLGVSTAIVTAVGDDGHGEHVREFLASEGVDVRWLRTRPGTQTQVAFFEAWPPDTFPVTFHRSAPAPETLALPADLAPELTASAPLVILSGALLAAEPARSSALAMLEARAFDRRHGPRWTVLDLDWRPTLWSDPAEAPPLVRQAAARADLVIGSDEEFAAVRLSPRALVERGARLVAVKHGPGGSTVISDLGSADVPGIPVDVICGLGSGDAFAAAFTTAILRGSEPAAALGRANAAGAIVASRLMCSTSMPTATEIDAILARTGRRPTEAPA